MVEKKTDDGKNFRVFFLIPPKGSLVSCPWSPLPLILRTEDAAQHQFCNFCLTLTKKTLTQPPTPLFEHLGSIFLTDFVKSMYAPIQKSTK